MDVDGVWEFSLASPVGGRPGRIELVSTRRGGLTGTWMVAAGSVAISEGRVEGNRVQWTIDSPHSPVGALTFTATIEGERMVGTGRVGGRTAMEIDAQRIAAPARPRGGRPSAWVVAGAAGLALAAGAGAGWWVRRGGRRRGR
jgi:hypothetical protein